jgi:hypothetical protein
VRSSRGHPDLVFGRSSSTLRSSWLRHGRYTQAAFTLRLAALGSSGIHLSSCGRTCRAAAPAINVAFAVPSLPTQVDQSAAEAWAALSAPWRSVLNCTGSPSAVGVWASGACSPTQPERCSAVVAISVSAPRGCRTLPGIARTCRDRCTCRGPVWCQELGSPAESMATA